MRRFVEVAKKSQVPEGGAIGEKIEGRLLGVVNLRGEIYELEGPCPMGRSLARTSSVPGTGCASTSRPTRDLAVEDVTTYKVRLAGDAVEVEI